MSKTSKSTKPKRGTVGHSIEKLVHKYGHYPLGLYILARAVEQAHKAEGIRFQIGLKHDLLASETPGYKEAMQKEAEILERALKWVK